MEYIADTLSSSKLADEIKYRIKKQYKNQDCFAKEFGSCRKSINRKLNVSMTADDLFRMCSMLGIKEIRID